MSFIVWLLLDLKTWIVLFAIYFILKNILGTQKNIPKGPHNFFFFGPTFQLLAYKGDLLRLFRDYTEIYGSIFSMRLGGRLYIILNDYESINKALHHPDLQDRPTRLTNLIREFTGFGHGVSSANGHIWKEQRKFITTHLQTFGVYRNSYEEFLHVEGKKLVQGIMATKCKSFDPQHLLSMASFNIIFRITNGDHFGYSDQMYQDMINVIMRMSEASLLASPLTLLPFLKNIPYGPHMKWIRHAQEFYKFSVQMVDSHKAKLNENHVNCLLDSYLQQIKNQKYKKEFKSDVFNEPNLHSNIGALFMAGAETTIATIRWAILALVHYPHYQCLLQNEMDKVVGLSPKIADRHQLPLMEAFLCEVQRWGVVAPLMVPHRASKDVALFGYTIPMDATITCNAHAVFHDKNTWKEPHEFRLERFIDDEGKFMKRKEMMPFGTGPRQCLGKQLAKMELFIFMTILIYNFTIKLPEGAKLPDTKGKRGVTLKPKPYEVVMVPRHHPCENEE